MTNQKPRIKITRRRAIAVLGAGAVGLGLSQLGDRDDIQVERRTLRLPRWDADGFKIALITDLHMDSKSKGDRAVRAATLASLEKPDVVLIGGDIVSTSKPDGIEQCHRALHAILALGIPTVGVLGNHEYQTKGPAEIIAGLTKVFGDHKMPLLRNETYSLDGVTVCGIDDGIAGRDRHDFLTPVQSKNVVTLFHEPDYVDRVDTKASLMLAGHSHGGQMCLPFGVALATPRGARKYIKGYYASTPVPLYVSRGVGTVGPSVRTFCPPEVTILTLQSS